MDGERIDRLTRTLHQARSRRGAIGALGLGAFLALRGSAVAQMDAGAFCNTVRCGPEEYCCNFSCSRCVPNGEGCTRELCRPTTMPVTGEMCGKTTCPPGHTCCNESCGTCVPPGVNYCPAIYCLP